MSGPVSNQNLYRQLERDQAIPETGIRGVPFQENKKPDLSSHERDSGATFGLKAKNFGFVFLLKDF